MITSVTCFGDQLAVDDVLNSMYYEKTIRRVVTSVSIEDGRLAIATRDLETGGKAQSAARMGAKGLCGTVARISTHAEI